MRRLPLFTAFAVLCIASAISVQCLEFRVTPYLQNPSENAATIMWITDQASTGQVLFGTTPGALTKIVSATNVTSDICKVRIGGLAPSTKYYYKIKAKAGDGGMLLSAIRSFTTLDSRAAAVHAVFLNDIHNQLPLYRQLAGVCSRFGYSLAFLNGDMWDYPGNRDDVLRCMSTYVGAMDPSAPLLFAHGNHEWRGSFSDQLWTLFDMPNLSGKDDWGKQRWYYSLTQGPVHFVVLDCGEDVVKKMDVFQPYRNEEAEWLKREVQSPEFRNAAFRVLVMHIPLYSHYGNEYNDYGRTSPPSRKILEPILKSAGIDMAISAHIHSTQVFDPRVGDNGSHFPYPLVIGGGPSQGTATAIELAASKSLLRATILNSSGHPIRSISVKSKK